MLQQLTKIEVDNFIDSLEEMMNARDDMWYEKKYSNDKQLRDIEEKRYNPAKEKVKNFLYSFLKKELDNS